MEAKGDLTFDERVAVMRHLCRQLEHAIPTVSVAYRQENIRYFNTEADDFVARLDRLREHIKALAPKISLPPISESGIS